MNIDSKYERLLEIFEEISKIPRDSKNESEIANFICEFAKNKGLEYKIDDCYNVIVRKPASLGMEDKKKIIFQAHLDMVCEKTSDSNHDFTKDPIEIIKNEETYTAKDTTLGADDGIGISISLLLMESNNIDLPETYYVFTTQEEIGMDGAKSIDLSDVKADYLINLDSEEENSVIIGCAGGITLHFNREDILYDIYDQVYRLSISGLKGGHSGVDIDKGRLNSNILGAKILSQLESIHLISFKGGTKTNVIPSETIIEFSTKTENVDEEIKEIVDKLELVEEDNSLVVTTTKLEGEYKGLSEKSSLEVIELLLNLKQNVITKREMVDTSGNVAIVDLKNGNITISESLRSNITNELSLYKDENIELANKLGFIIQVGEEYPGWDYDSNSKLTEMYVKAYQNTHDEKSPIITAIHAGLECGVLKEKLPNVEAISIGPDLENVHTPDETLYLASCKKLLETIVELVKKIN